MDRCTRFVILFSGRTGSTWLTSSLDSHPQVVAEGERLVRRSAGSQRRWIRRLYRRAGRRGVLAAGFKTKLKDVWDLDAFRDLLQDHDVRVIVMYRRNTVKLAVSAINARRLRAITGRWNRRPGDAALPPFELTEEELRQEIRKCMDRDRELEAYAAALELPQIVLHYEDLLANPDERMDEVMSFLQAPAVRLRSEYLKNTDDDLSRVLVNYEALRARFADDPLGALF